MSAPRRQRLDAEMVRRRLVDSRTEAARAIDAARVLVNGAIADKASRLVHAGDAVVLTGAPARFVSRGGEKLDGALATLGLDVSGWRVLDAGASTGGFTDCLLQRGAAHVVALDVGHGQLHPRIRAHPRVTVLERCHVRTATPESIGGLVDMVTADLSFISITRVLDALVGACRPGGHLVLLVKPQFEAGKAEVSRGHGVITDPLIHERVRGEVHSALVEKGCDVGGWVDSPITGGDGNREFLVHATTPRQGSPE
ncbi:MAG: TlyA family RNA methyltransferase [Actinomycetota bacterium]|nr:TlyA family RNA methyltransferase [Actinomycetota bacterium]